MSDKPKKDCICKTYLQVCDGCRDEKQFKPKTIEEIEPDIHTTYKAEYPVNSKDITTLAAERVAFHSGAHWLIGNHYATLLTAYTTTRAELDKAKKTVAELHVGIKEIREMLEGRESDLERAGNYIAKQNAELDTVKAELDRGKELMKEAYLSMDKVQCAIWDNHKPEVLILTEKMEEMNEYLNPAPPHKN